MRSRGDLFITFSVPVLYSVVDPLRGGLNCANNYYWDKHTHYRRSCHFHRIPLHSANSEAQSVLQDLISLCHCVVQKMSQEMF